MQSVIRSKPLLVCLLTVFASHFLSPDGYAADDRMQVFGITLGAPLTLPKCPDQSTFDAKTPMCQRDIPGSDLFFLDSNTAISMPMKDTPSWMSTESLFFRGAFSVWVFDGRVIKLRLSTKSGYYDGAVMQVLRGKYGNPTRVWSGGGEWSLPGLHVHYFVHSNEFGIITIESDAGRRETANLKKRSAEKSAKSGAKM